MAEHGDQSTPGPEGIHACGGSAGNRGSRKPLSKDSEEVTELSIILNSLSKNLPSNVIYRH